jgi:hypothetical protein
MIDDLRWVLKEMNRPRELTDCGSDEEPSDDYALVYVSRDGGGVDQCSSR